MTELRKGWCPGALRPMPAKDGLLVRLKITGGILPAATARTLADLAERHGSGLFDLSSRGNLQIRGVRPEALAPLQDGLHRLGLVDTSASGEAVRNVIASPLAGLHDGPDIRPLTQTLERRLTVDNALHALPAKFGFLIDDGSAPSLANIPTDVRFDWEGDVFAIGLGGTRNAAVGVGWCSADELVECAARLGQMAVVLFERCSAAHRMHDLVAQIGRDRVVEQFGAASSPTDGERPHPIFHRATFSRKREKERAPSTLLRLAMPFGRLDPNMLRAAATAAEESPNRELRLTPWRAILIPDATRRAVPGFITDPADPRLRIAACVGTDGCDKGSTHTRDDALRLSGAIDTSKPNDILLHVSGCEKGCAKASSTPLTLVARDGRYDLVRDGRAGDTPIHRGLSFDNVRKLLASELERA